MPTTTVEQVLQQIWSDPATKQKLQTDPKAFLTGYGVPIPPDAKVEVHEDSPSLKNFVLPEKIEGDRPATDPVASLIQRALKDPAFKSKLMSDPKETVLGMGVAVPDGVGIRVYQNSGETLHFVLPTNPAQSELNDEDLEAVAGGAGKGSAPTTNDDQPILGSVSGAPKGGSAGGPLDVIV
jgi:hypothetical protein